MALSQGSAIIWGSSVSGISSYAAASGATHAFTGDDIAYESDVAEIKNAYGNVITQYFYNYRKKLSLKCYPAGSGADACSVPVVGEKVTVTALADSGEPSGTSSAGVNTPGDYVATSVSKARSNEGHVEFDIELTRYDFVTPA